MDKKFSTFFLFRKHVQSLLLLSRTDRLIGMGTAARRPLSFFHPLDPRADGKNRGARHRVRRTWFNHSRPSLSNDEHTICTAGLWHETVSCKLICRATLVRLPPPAMYHCRQLRRFSLRSVDFHYPAISSCQQRKPVLSRTTVVITLRDTFVTPCHVRKMHK